MSEQTVKKPRGFQVMSEERKKEIASLGGKAAHRAGTAHEMTSAEAVVNGRKGGLARAAKRRAQAEARRKAAEVQT